MPMMFLYCLKKQIPNFKQPEVWNDLKLSEGNYIVMTLHRPANVDEESQLKDMIDEIIAHTEDLPLVFPVHPRTAKILERLKISHPRLHNIEPLSYL